MSENDPAGAAPAGPFVAGESDVTFPHLTEAQMATIEAAGRRGQVSAGQILFSPGDLDLTHLDVDPINGGRPSMPLETSLPGVFAVGDGRTGSIKRVASAVGEGSMSVRLVHQYLASHAALGRS
jgi:NADPH-dependent glutamate synthase beta subunit-like oxidoreductase